MRTYKEFVDYLESGGREYLTFARGGIEPFNWGPTPSDSVDGKTTTFKPSIEFTPGLSLGLSTNKVASPEYLDRFKFGPASLKEQIGVRKELLAVANLAIRYSTQDFTFFDGLRTLKEQQRLVAEGKSKTMKSKHLTGDAMDLVPYHNGKPTWDWKLIYPIAFAVDKAATELGFADKIRWGGAWDRTLADFGESADVYLRETQLYAERHPGKDFVDGPHYEWVG